MNYEEKSNPSTIIRQLNIFSFGLTVTERTNHVISGKAQA